MGHLDNNVLQNKLLDVLTRNGMHEKLGNQLFHELDSIASEYNELRQHIYFIQGAAGVEKCLISDLPDEIYQHTLKLNMLDGYRITIPTFVPSYSAEEFKKWRSDRKLSVTNCSRLLGVSPYAVKSWETGVRKVSTPVAMLMCAYNLSEVKHESV